MAIQLHRQAVGCVGVKQRWKTIPHCHLSRVASLQSGESQIQFGVFRGGKFWARGHYSTPVPAARVPWCSDRVLSSDSLVKEVISWLGEDCFLTVDWKQRDRPTMVEYCCLVSTYTCQNELVLVSMDHEWPFCTTIHWCFSILFNFFSLRKLGLKRDHEVAWIILRLSMRVLYLFMNWMFGTLHWWSIN